MEWDKIPDFADIIHMEKEPGDCLTRVRTYFTLTR